MTTHHIGGFRFGATKPKDASIIFRTAFTGDTIKVHARTVKLLESVVLTNRSLYIEGDDMEKNIIYLPSKGAGFSLDGQSSLHLSNVTLIVDGQSNALNIHGNTQGKLFLTNVRILYKPNTPMRERFPQIMTSLYQAPEGTTVPQIEARIVNCEIASANLYASDLRIIDSTFVDTVQGSEHEIIGDSLDVTGSTFSNAHIRVLSENGAVLPNNVFMGNVNVQGIMTLHKLTLRVPPILATDSGRANVQKFLKQNNLNSELLTLFNLEQGNVPTNVTLSDVQFDTRSLDEQALTLQALEEKGFPVRLFNFTSMTDTLVPVTIRSTKIVPGGVPSMIHGAKLVFENVEDQESWQFTHYELTANVSNTRLERGRIGQNGSNDVQEATGEVVMASEQDALAELDNLTGLENAKKSIRRIVSVASMNKQREMRGLPVTAGLSAHTVFAGEAGTGKTTVARLYGKALLDAGVLKNDKFIEVTRKDLVAGYVGQTADKTHAKFMEAMGGILFIDEAYSLQPTGGNDFADEAISQLIADMENHRDDVIVILAGYTDEMKKFINTANTGLKSRFTSWVEFDAYNEDELVSIFHHTLGKSYTFAENKETERLADESLIRVFRLMHSYDPKSTGNARFVRNYAQALVMAKDLRVAMLDMAILDDNALSTFTADDVIEAENQMVDTANATRI